MYICSVYSIYIYIHIFRKFFKHPHVCLRVKILLYVLLCMYTKCVRALRITTVISVYVFICNVMEKVYYSSSDKWVSLCLLKTAKLLHCLNPKQRRLCNKTMKRILKVTVTTIKELHESDKRKWTEKIKEVQRFPKPVQCTETKIGVGKFRFNKYVLMYLCKYFKVIWKKYSVC